MFNEITSPEKRLIVKEDLVATLDNDGFDVLLTVGAGDICNYLPEIVKLAEKRS